MDEKELLFSHVLGCSRTQLYIDRRRKLDPDSRLAIAHTLRRRAAGEPLEYILGRTDFMGRQFYLNGQVLIPRPETELLVEAVLDYCRLNKVEEPQILEIGTGSGAIAVSLAAMLGSSHITATDISPEALSVARKNAKLNLCSAKIDFLHCDIFPPRKKLYDVIVSNPPYVRTADIEGLSPEVRCQPRLALDGGADGLKVLQRIIRQSPEYIRHDGALFLEVGFDQCADVRSLIGKTKKLTVKDVIKDYNTIQRIIVAQNQPRTTDG